jgi:hypothetical protein
MKNIIFLSGLLNLYSVLAQNPHLNYKNAIKIYNLTTYERDVSYTNDTTPFSIHSKVTAIQMLHPTIALQFRSKTNNFHEVELTNLVLNRFSNKSEIINDTSGKVQATVNNNRTRSTFISIRYEYILNFNKIKDRKMVPSVGFSVGPYFKQNEASSGVLTAYNFSEKLMGARINTVPRLTYYVSSRIFFDINIPICFFEMDIRTTQNDNPAIPVNQQKVTNFNINVFPNKFTGRVGVGIKL